jgi:entericidin A
MQGVKGFDAGGGRKHPPPHSPPNPNHPDENHRGHAMNYDKLPRILSLALLSAVLAGSLTACNTVDGAGKDIEELGEEIQEEAADKGKTEGN